MNSNAPDLDIEFTDEQQQEDLLYTSRVLFGEHSGKQRPPDILDTIKKIPFITTDKRAYYFLLTVAIVCALLTIAFITYVAISEHHKKTAPLYIPEWLKP